MEQKHKGKGDQKIQHQINELRKKINNLLQFETETKARYVKQNYYESGPKGMKLLARQLRKQQAEITVKTTQPKNKQG